MDFSESLNPPTPLRNLCAGALARGLFKLLSFLSWLSNRPFCRVISLGIQILSFPPFASQSFSRSCLILSVTFLTFAYSLPPADLKF